MIEVRHADEIGDNDIIAICLSDEIASLYYIWPGASAIRCRVCRLIRGDRPLKEEFGLGRPAPFTSQAVGGVKTYRLCNTLQFPTPQKALRHALVICRLQDWDVSAPNVLPEEAGQFPLHAYQKP